MAPVSDPDVVIAVDRVSVHRGGTALLRDVSWRVELDERWVVLGPNGAGKTTLLNLAAARLHPTRGTVDVLGERLGRVDLPSCVPGSACPRSALHDRIPPESGARRRGDRVMGRGRAVPGGYAGWTPRGPRALLHQLGAAGAGRAALRDAVGG